MILRAAGLLDQAAPNNRTKAAPAMSPEGRTRFKQVRTTLKGILLGKVGVV